MLRQPSLVAIYPRPYYADLMASTSTSLHSGRKRVWLRSWATSRWVFLSGAFIIAMAVLLATTRAWPFAAEPVASWWVTPAVVLLSASFAFGAASLAGARGSRAATVCDLRPVLAAGIAGYIAVLPPGSGTAATELLASLGSWGLSVGQPLLALVGILAPVLTVRDRFDAEMFEPEEGETCATCTPLPSMGSHSLTSSTSPRNEYDRRR